MTIQRSDYMFFNKKKYYLIDIELGKSIISEIDLTIPEGCEVPIITSSWRGYTATYSIVDNCLFGIKHIMVFRKSDSGKIDSFEISSPQKRFYYTGSCIIAYNEQKSIFDFEHLYLGYSDALELHFTEGVLDETRSLNDMVRKFRDTLQDRLTQENEDGVIPFENWKMIDDFARSGLKYQYDRITYIWNEKHRH